MTDDEYRRRCLFLREVLKDAEERGDYHLEMDVKEELQQLRDKYHEEDSE